MGELVVAKGYRIIDVKGKTQTMFDGPWTDVSYGPKLPADFVWFTVDQVVDPWAKAGDLSNGLCPSQCDANVG